MNTKLTLRMEESLILRAKTFARRTGKSVSQLVAEYFSALGGKPDDEDSELTPIVKSLKGALRNRKAGREDYRRYLEKKYQ